MSKADEPDDRGPEMAMAAATGAGGSEAPVQPVRARRAANRWARQGRVAIQSSHGLSAPLVRVVTEWVAHEANRSTMAAPGEREPEIAIPETVVQPRPPQRLPEDAVRRSPIAGLVIAVIAAPGQAVRRHEAVLIIEAMKMQNHVGPEVDGVLKAIHVSPGDAVKAGQVLFELA